MMSGGQGLMGGGFMWIFWIAVIVGIIFLVGWVVQKSRRSHDFPSFGYEREGF